MGNENGLLLLLNIGLWSGIRVDGEGNDPNSLLVCHQVVSVNCLAIETWMGFNCLVDNLQVFLGKA